jgi:hypothetical protein
MQVVGSVVSTIVFEPVLCYDWIVPDFLNLARDDIRRGPDFVVQNKKFKFSCSHIRDQFLITVEGCSGSPSVLARGSLSLVSNIGSEKCIRSFVLEGEELVGKLIETEFTTDFLPNDELRVRCRIEIEGEPAAKVDPMHGQTLIENLRKEYVGQSALTFTDCSLVSLNCSS